MASKSVKAPVPAVQRTKLAVAVEAPLPEGALAPGEKHKAEEVKKVEGKASKLVVLEYKKDNTHILHHVHAISKGLNHIPEDVWAHAKLHPANASLLKSGDLVEVKEEAAKPAKAKGLTAVEASAEPKAEEVKEEKSAG